MASYRVLYNPYSAAGTGDKHFDDLRSLMSGDELTFTSMTGIDSYADFFSSLPEGEDVIICGGDGTLNRFINESEGVDYGREILYFAAGSGNDFLHDIGGKVGEKPVSISKYLKDLPKVTVKGKTYSFINGIGYGIDGYCCEVGDKLRKKSTKPVNYAGIAIKGLLFHYKPTNAVVTVDGKARSYSKVWLAPTMFGRFYGGGMIPTPDQDRLSDKRTVSTMVLFGSGKFKTLIVFPSIFKGEHVKHTEMVEVMTGHEVNVKFDRPVALQIDGETVLGVSEYSVSCK